MIDNSDEENEDGLTLMGLEGPDLVTEVRCTVFVVYEVAKRILHLGKEDWGISLLHQSE